MTGIRFQCLVKDLKWWHKLQINSCFDIVDNDFVIAVSLRPYSLTKILAHNDVLRVERELYAANAAEALHQ